jgi:hypothetical protein
MRRLGLLVVGLWVGLGWSSAASAIPIQWTVVEGGNGHWYEGIIATDSPENGVTWHEANVLAQNGGGYLATATSDSENAWILNNVVAPMSSLSFSDGNYGPWIGGYQDRSAPDYSEPGGGWRWVTGEAWSFTAWGPPSAFPDNFNGGQGGATPETSVEDHLHYWLFSSPVWNDALANDAEGTANRFDYIVEYDTNPIPEPSTALLLGLGLVGMAARRRG